jgi:hypothetical protein
MKSVIALMLLLFQMHLVSYCVEPDTVFVLSSNDKGWDVDDLGNLYVYDNYELRRYNRDKELTATFSSREFGPIGSLDVVDPLRPALFYPMFTKIIELDQSLSISATWSPEIGARASSLIGSRSAGQGYWIYDDLDRRPVKFDQNGKPLLQGTSLSSIESGNVLISEILCNGQWMVLNDKSFGFFVYDQYGTFSFKLFSPGNQLAGIGKGDLYYLTEKGLIKRNFRTGFETTFPINLKNDSSSVKVRNERIFVQLGKVILEYRL